ncbi:uncharacterized protein LOC117298529 [Asterias rubens]|uniref:uncharacterized protein LOC117298529 n=1 Tax=Asterias rubens TaxID=7604 RepID=UPI001454FB17|nr:uncharacterized protein LOC117298529 [Asterias rubens]
MTSPSYGKLSNCTLVKIWLVFILGVGTFTMEPVLASFIRFKADTEYVYNFQSSTEMKTVERLLAKSKIGFLAVKSPDTEVGFQQIYLRVHSAAITSSNNQVFLNEEHDFDRWFSFEISENGTIGHVYYSGDESDHVITAKKGMASLLAANLQHPPDGMQNDGRAEWSYDCNETGHEGHHESSYNARMSTDNDGIIVFTKTRRTHPIPYGKSKHQKEIHYHPGMKLPTLVKILDHYEAPRESTKEFQGQFKENTDEEGFNLPEMQTVSDGQLTFVREIYTPSLAPPTNGDLVTDTIHVKKIPDGQHLIDDITTLKDMVSGNLTCMRNAPLEGSHERSHCYQDLVHTLVYNIDERKLAEIVKPLYQLPLSRRHRDKEDRLNMLDAVTALETDFSQSLLADLILLSPKPNKDLVERLLIASSGFTRAISKHYLETLEDIVFKPQRFPEPLRDSETQRVAVMVLGALAGNLWTAGYKSQAEAIVVKIEDKLGVHDPWSYSKTVTTLSEDELDEYHHNTVACIEALGNAALHRSFAHIHSYTNSTTTHPLLKRAGLHSMRDYHHDKAAGILLKSALDEDEDEHVRYEASLLYKDHPNGVYKHSSKFVNPEEYMGSTNSSELMSTEGASSPSRRRVRRGFWEGIEFHLASPAIQWEKLIGSSKTGAQFGLTVRNALDIKIAPLSGHLRLDILDEAYATVLVGLVGTKMDIARARFCFNGHIEYNLNILQEFGVERINELVKVFDLIIGQVVGNIVRAVDIVVNLFKGDTSINKLFDDFVEALENIPSRISGMRSVAANAVARLSQFDPDQLPPSIHGVIMVVNKAAQLFSDIKTDVMEFYSAINEAITVTLPSAAEAIQMAIESISGIIKDLLKSPLTAIGDIFKGVINVKMAVDSIFEAKKNVEKANFLKEGQRPYWFDLPKVIGDMIEELAMHLGNIRRDLKVWVDEVQSADDPIKKLTGGALDSHTLRTQVQSEIESILMDLMEPIEPIKELLAPFFEIYDLVFNTIKAVKEAYQTLKVSYQKSLSLVMKLFGPKAHEKFPRKYRSPGSGECASGGFYPTDSAGHYEDQGVDLEMPQGAKLVAPFSGEIYRTLGKPNQVTLEAKGGSFRDIKIFIDNIIPNDTLSETLSTSVIAGTEIGRVESATACAPPNYIHLSMKKTKPNRLASILDSALDDNQTAADLAAKEGYVDPSNYLAKRPLEIPKWIQVCNDYKVVWKGKTVLEGTLPKDKAGKMNDTTPKRGESPSTSTERPNQAEQPPPRQSPLNQAVTPSSRDETQEALGFPQPKIGSGSPFKNFTLRNLKISSILAFARKLKLVDTADELLKVVKTIVKLVSDKPCVLPESMTNDALRIELQQRGLSSQGDRKMLLQRYKEPEDRCPLLQLSLPKNVYCKIDESCFGVECCMNIKLFMVSLAFKAFMRFDPCEFQFIIGVNSWNYTVQILEAEWGKQWEVPVPFDVPFVDDMKLHLRFGIEKTKTQLLVSMSVGFCPESGDAECLEFIDVLQDSAVPLPICNPDGTFTWPEIDVEEYFSRARLHMLIKETGEELIRAGLEAAFEYVVEELGIDEGLLDGKEPCPTPASLSDSQLIGALEGRDLETTGSRAEKEIRLSDGERSCGTFTLPAFSGKVAEIAYCSISENCLRIDCCLELNIKVREFKFSRSFKAFIDVNACDFSITIAFQHFRYTKVLLSYDWGDVKYQKIGPFTLRYTIDKLDDEKQFQIDFGASVCPINGEECIFKIDIIQDYRVPIPFCNSNFSLSLPGKTNLTDFITQVGQNAAQQAINILLQFIGLRDKIDDGPCASTTQDVCTDVTLPSLPSTLTCDLYDRCLGVRCCVDLDLQITVLSSNVWLELDPCEFTLSMGFGKWSITFTIFDYHWGTQEELKIGKALTLIYTIDKLTEDKVFVLDLALSFCLPDSICDTAPSIDILKGTRVPIPLCNENATFALPGDGTVSDFLKMVGKNAAESGIDAVLTALGLSNFISQEPCVRPQVTNNGWHRVCPRDVRLPHLPSYLICTLPEKCLGFDCCFELPIPGLTPISTNVSFIFDPCNYKLSLGLGSWSKDLHIFTYQWGQQEEVTIGNAVSLSLTIDKVEESFQINLDMTFCLDGDCTPIPILSDAIIPIPFCNPNASFELPGDGSFAALARDIGGNVGELAIQAGLRKLGIQEFTTNQRCDLTVLAPAENKCPLMNKPPSTNILTCTVDDQCLGIHCCASLDLIFTRLSTTAWVVLDPCEFELSVGFGSWTKNLTLFEYDWGVERTVDISDTVYIVFTVDKLTAQKEFLIDLSVSLCIDGTCTPINLLQGARVPIPICNPNATFSLPGDGSIAGYLDTITGEITNVAVDLVLGSLGLKNFLSRNTCSLPLPDEGCPVQIPTGLPTFSCRINSHCTSLHCCLNLDLKVTQLSSKAWLEIDPCDFKLSVGMGMWYFNISLFSYEWGKMERFPIGQAMSVEFSIDKLDASKEYEIDLAFSLQVDDETTDFPLMEAKRIPIPICNNNFSLTLPGDGSVRGFLEELGDTVGQSAIDLVLRKLNLDDVVSGRSCELPAAMAMNTACPMISLPTLANIIQCSTDDNCLGIQCCVNLNFIITTLMLDARIKVDPCNFQLHVNFENWERIFTLFSYTWGKVEMEPISDVVTLSYSVDKLTEMMVFSVTLDVELCIDNACVTTSILDHVWVPIPICNINPVTFTLPGDGTVAGFITELGGRIGDSAIDLVLEKYGLNQYFQSEQCDRGTPGTLKSSCPGVDLEQLPDFLSCSLTESCLGIKCCLEMDFKIVTRTVNAWLILDPCNFKLSIGFENWEQSITLFHYAMGDYREEVINSVLSVRWRVKKLTVEKQFELNLQLVFCLDEACNTVTVFEGSRLPIPLCNTEDSFALPGDGTVSGFLGYLDGNIGQFAIDAAIRHLNLDSFLSGKACSNHRQDVCSSATGILGDCSIVGEFCTELRCCLDLDLKIADVSASAWFKFDPCDLTFTLGLETWMFHGSVFTYEWGEETMVPVAPGMTLRYSITKLDESMEFQVDMTLEYCVDELCTDIDIVQTIPIPVCNQDYSSYNFSVDGFVQTVSGQIVQGVTELLLNQLGIDPDFFSGDPCVNPNGIQSYRNCPNMQLPGNLDPIAQCGILESCFGIKCCLDVNLGPLDHSFSASMVVDPCLGQLKLQFGNWEYSKSLSQLDIGVDKEVTIGNFVSLIFKLELSDGKISSSLSMDACVGDVCTGRIVLLDESISPLPQCYSNGSISWRKLPGLTSISHLGNLDTGLDVLAQGLGLPTRLVSASPCLVEQTSSSTVCPHLPVLPALPSGGVCQYSDTCLGVECCLSADIGSTTQTLRAWLTVDPCELTASVGFENWSFNITLLSYKWGKQIRESLSDVVSISFTIDKTSNNRNFVLSLSVKFCIAGLCAPDIIILDGFMAPIPFCDVMGTLEWPQDLGGSVTDYASSLVVNRLGVSTDVLLPQSCSGPPEQITPTTSGCGSLSIPSAIASYCFLDESCLGVGCCLTLDLDIVQRSFSVWVKLDVCAGRFSFGFEEWSHSEVLNIATLQTHSQEKNIGNVKIRYNIERPHESVYDVDLDLAVCWQGRCTDPIVILQDTMFSASQCGQEGSSSRRERRNVDDLTNDLEEEEGNMDDFTTSSLDKALEYFRKILKSDSPTLSSEENILMKLQPEKNVPPRVAGSGTESRRASGTLIFGNEDNTPVPSRKRRDVSIAVTSGGASLFDLSLTPGADSGAWQGDVIIGGGLTLKGLDALGNRIANMTIGELEAMLDLQNIDPFTVVQLMKDLRSLYRTFVSEFIDVFVNGNGENAFSQFDIVLSGEVPFPRREVVFFKHKYWTVLGGFIYLEFYIEAGGFFDMKIPISVALVSMTAKGGIIPMVGSYVTARVTVGFILYGELELKADVLHTSFPTTAELIFSKFPLDVGLKMDIVMIPLIIRLTGKVTLKILWFGTKTLFKKDLWRYQANAIHKNIFDVHTKDPDTSPPEVMDYSTPVEAPHSGERSVNIAEPTSHCSVEQVPGLDYTEPAFQLEVVAADDKSLVTFFYQVGTVPGGSDVLPKTEYGGPSAIISQILLGGHPLHFTVYAMNNGGGTSTATCSLPTFDVTLPTGRITPDFTSTSHPHILRASAVVYDDSVILMQKEGVGFGPEIWGDQIVPWHTIDITEREQLGTSINDFHYFTTAKKGRLISTPTSTITHINPNFCARDCLALPETKCLSINYDYDSKMCELLKEIEGHGVEVHESGKFTHYERLGVGHAVEFNHESLLLDHNNIYYFNIDLLNYVAYENIVSSVGIVADFTAPEPGLIVNASRDEVVHEPCVQFTPDEWERRCMEDTPLDNHRYIIDGPGSMTVFNGEMELVDMLYTRSNAYMAANWDGIHDNETGIHGYTWSIGYSVCNDDVSSHIDPHAHLFDESQWHHQGLVVNVNLPDGAYFISVRALNKVEFGGPMALTVCHSTPLIIDNTPPIIDSINNITYESSIGRIGLQVNASDPDSHLFEYHVAAGRSPRDISLHDWEALAVTQQLIIDFKIPNGIPCWLIVRAVNNVDLRTVEHADEPILVDDTPPIAGDLFDGPYAGRDLAFTKDRNEICGNWYNWFDPDSGISSYLWAVGTQPLTSNVVNFVKVSRREHGTCSGYVTLQHGETYYSTLVAFHGGYDKLNVSASSNGVSVDLTPPVQGSVYDGLLPGPTDLEFSSKPATVSAQWQGFSDPESGIEDYQVTVYRKHSDSENATNDFEVIHEAASVSNDVSLIEWHHFHLHHKDQVYINLRTINQAVNHIDTPTNGFLVDLTPPMLRSLGDGLVVGQDADFQTHSDSLAVHWDYFDEESGIALFELAIYEMRHGKKQKIFPADLDPNTFEPILDVTTTSHVQSGLSLRAGAIYITRIKAQNQAKLIASHETSGIRVDPTPPEMKYVRGGNLDGETEEVINGYLFQNSLSTIKASWLGVDGQSGIKNYWVAVGTAQNTEDIKPFMALGSKRNSVLLNLDLQLTDQSTCNDEEFTADCRPVYYVCVKSENGAGAFSDVICSSPIRVVEEDQTGYVTDGPAMLHDTDSQQERTTVTIWFDDFESQLHGISSYEWAVGTTPGGEDIQPLTSDGVVPGSDPDIPGLAGLGKAQSPLPLQHGVTYYSTVRAITNGDNVLETVSNGFTVDVTPPNINITDFGQYGTTVDLGFGGVKLYQSFVDSIDAMWDVEDSESNLIATYFTVGQYAGASDVFPLTHANNSYIPSSLVKPALEGLPNILTVRAINSVGLKQTVYTTSLTVDTTPPDAGQVMCPSFLHANSALKCRWTDFLDDESGIEYVRFLVGTAEGLNDVFVSDKLPGYMTHYSATDLDLMHNKLYYVTIEAFNAVSQSTYAFSEPIEIDDTPPSYGVVVELSGVHKLNQNYLERQPSWDCSNMGDCLELDGECLESITQIQILWEPFKDEDTRITKYEVALGTTPGGTQIRSFYEVDRYQTSELITDLDLSDVRRVYASVRGYNEAGLTSTAVSNGIFVSRFSAGLQPLRPFTVKDGVTSNDLHDLDFQTSLTELSASWDFSGDPCPIRENEWAIYRIDGVEIQPLTDVGDRTSDTNTFIEMMDGETYYTVVRATNALNIPITLRSDGITVKRDPLIPGQVYDGLLAGFDLTYQRETDTISASWSGFGQGMPIQETVEYTGNAEITKDHATEQAVDYYEVAVGTDRRYPKTRDNTVPFTNVGQNTSVTFNNLDLQALTATYYVTVKGHSASFSAAEVTSSGIHAGVDSKISATEVKIPEFVNSLSEVKLQWEEFDSTFPILLYYVGLGNAASATVSPENMDCLDMLLATDEAKTAFNERKMHFIGKDTYQEIKGLSLEQEGSYFVTVVGMNEGGQCNSSTSHFSVDITPPIEGRLRAGPFYGMLVTYTDSTESIHVAWEDYIDEESGIKSFNIRLLEAASCRVEDSGNLTPVPGQEWLVLGPGISEFTYVELSLATNHPYFVELEAVNRAGDSTVTKVGPIFVDLSEPSSGLVVDGDDFMMDLTDTYSRSQVTGTILHQPNPEGPPCPLTDTSFTDPKWQALDFNGLWNMRIDNWDLEYQNQQVSASDESVSLKMERDTRGPRMLSGAYVTNAQIVRSSEYEFDLLAASSDLHSVTSILFWDGPDRVVGEYDFGGAENWQEGICQCCYATPFYQSECPQCDCKNFLGIDESTSDYSSVNSTTVDLVTTETADMTTADEAADMTTADEAADMTTADEAADMITVSSPQVNTDVVTMATRTPWTIRKKDADGDGISDEDGGRWTTQRACGLQLHPNGNASQAVLWCRYFEDEWPMTSQSVDLDFDPSMEEHHYSIHFSVMPFDAKEDEWSFNVYIDGNLLSSLTGIPVMSSSTKLILHVFNKDSFVTDLDDPFNPPTATATIKNLRMPPDASMLCRYGLPFRAGTNPVSRYFAGVGSEAGKTDIVAYKEISQPCVPCINPCDWYQCNQSCSMVESSITFTLTNLTLPKLEVLNTTRNDTNNTVSASGEDGLPSPFFLTVKCVLGNGQEASSSSNGFYIDDTPAKLDVLFYVDINRNEYEPTQFQSSNSTIQVLWSFLDTQSQIKEHYWAIGTSRGALDLQDFVNVGLTQTASNSNLEGQLQHNTTYYVTVKCINGAGLETVVESDGVTVLFEKPSVDDVNTTSMFSQKFEEEVYPPDVQKNDDPTKTGTSWSKPEDESIDRYEYCVSSSAELLDDIVPCMVVGTNASGSVAIRDGMIIVTADDREEVFNITDFQANREDSKKMTSQQDAKFNMEPGKCLYSWIKMCNPALLCQTLPAGTTTVLGEDDTMMTSANGTDLALASPQSNRRRRRRALDNNFEFAIATTGGLQQGGSLIIGLLDGNKTNEDFTSDANPDYVSYISYPLDTIQKTSRILKRRIRFVYEPLFYVTSLGQIELQGPMIINLTLNTPGNWTEAKPRLVYWDSDNSEWRDVAKTCSDVDRLTYNEGDSLLSVEVCATRGRTSEAGRRQRRATEETSFFSHETEFALADVLNTIPNDPPEITNPVGIFTMDEDQGTLEYSFEASDPDDDVLVFDLGLDNETTLGSATITEDGAFSFTPCPDCHGRFTFQLILREIQTLVEIEPLTTVVNISMEVNPVNDNPYSYVALKGEIAGNGREAKLIVEQNTGVNIAYKDLVVMIGAYDVDIYDNLTLLIQPPPYGVLTMRDEVRSIPLRQNCSQLSRNITSQEIVLPCGLETPQEAEKMSLVSSTFSYTPDHNFHGKDIVLVLSEDKSGAVSQLLTIEIAVLVNPCINEGVCGGPADDPDCTSPTRSSSFDSYFCICESGWVGDFCEIDYDECLSAPCEFPFVCYDLFNGFECACPLSDPMCKGLDWRVKIVIGVTCTVFGLFLITLVLFVFYKKGYSKKSRVHPSQENEEQLVQTRRSESYNFENPAFQRDDDIDASPSVVLSQDGPLSAPPGPSTVSPSTAQSQGSPLGSSASMRSDEYKSGRPRSRNGRSNSVGVAPLTAAEVPVLDDVETPRFKSGRSSSRFGRSNSVGVAPLTDAEANYPVHDDVETPDSKPEAGPSNESPVHAEKWADTTMPKGGGPGDEVNAVEMLEWNSVTCRSGRPGQVADGEVTGTGCWFGSSSRDGPISSKEETTGSPIQLPGSMVSIKEDEMNPEDIEETDME